MTGGKASIVSGVHGLKHIQCLRSTDLSDYDPVRSHSQGCFDQITDRNFIGILRIRLFRLHAHQVWNILDLKFGGILYRDYTFPRLYVI